MIRVRFAPSPTGMLHVGALRTVLYDHLLAKKYGGVNILRIEDTDRARYSAESEQEFIDTLAWVGIEFDEGPHVGGPNGPYRQSERKEAGIYAQHIQTLTDNGHAYRAFDTPEELAAMREHQEQNRLNTGYFGGEWRDASSDKVENAKGKPYVIRLRIPRNRTITLDDKVRGQVSWDSNIVDDPVLIKADGMPTYHFAAMVDDHLMGITHVLRGDEWIPSAPKHIALLEAFGWELPIFVHCPVILGKDGKKLSKRHGATRVLDYAAEGILPHPLKNFIALIGWSPGEDREVLNEAELVAAFDLDRLQPSPGHFDLEKLHWLSGTYLRSISVAELREEVIKLASMPHAQDYHLTPNEEGDTQTDRWAAFALLAERAASDPEYVEKCLALLQERVQTLVDLGEAAEFFLVDEPKMDTKAAEKWLGEPHIPTLFADILAFCEQNPHPTAAEFEARLRAFQKANQIEKLGPIVHPTRVALTGKTTGPGLFELMEVLGCERIARRTQMAVRG